MCTLIEQQLVYHYSVTVLHCPCAITKQMYLHIFEANEANYVKSEMGHLRLTSLVRA